MKVYIKPWHQATCFARDNNIATPIKYGQKTILGVTRRDGMWGRICETNKCGDVYVTTGRYSQSYPVCCVDEITPEWLEKNASKFAEEVITTDSTADTWDKSLENYETYRITIHKVMDALRSYFFYVKRVSYNGCDETVEDFREIN